MPTTSTIRENRIHDILSFIKQDCHGKTTRQKVIKIALTNWPGITIKTVESYLHTLVLTDRIRNHGNTLSIPKKKETK